jgi:hypothetical protein
MEDTKATICEDHLRTMYDDEMVEALDNGGCGCEVKDEIMCVTK